MPSPSGGYQQTSPVEQPKPLTPSLDWARCPVSQHSSGWETLGIDVAAITPPQHLLVCQAYFQIFPSSLTELDLLSISIFQAFRNVSDPGALTPGIGVGTRWPVRSLPTQTILWFYSCEYHGNTQAIMKNISVSAAKVSFNQQGVDSGEKELKCPMSIIISRLWSPRILTYLHQILTT